LNDVNKDKNRECVSLKSTIHELERNKQELERNKQELERNKQELERKLSETLAAKNELENNTIKATKNVVCSFIRKIRRRSNNNRDFAPI